MRRLILAIGFTLLAPATEFAGAQTATGVADVDSAAVARAAWRRGQVAMRSRDYPAAATELAHAAAAWPTQPAYVWGHAVAAARAGDEAALRRALTNYADLSLGNDAGSDTTLGRYLGRPDFHAIGSRLAANLAPMPKSRVVATLPDSTLWPEGMDYDPRSRTWYLASVRHRTIVAMQRNSAPRELWPAQTAGMGAVLAVRVDTSRGVLWATTSGIAQMAGYARADSAIAALLQVRMATASSSSAGTCRWRRAATCWATSPSVPRATCGSPTRTNPCSTGSARMPTRSSGLKVRGSAPCRAWPRRPMGVPFTSQIIRTAFCAWRCLRAASPA